MLAFAGELQLLLDHINCNLAVGGFINLYLHYILDHGTYYLNIELGVVNNQDFGNAGTALLERMLGKVGEALHGLP